MRVAIFGCGGFARAHHEAVRKLEEEGVCRLVAVCEPDADVLAQAERDFDFLGRGVSIHRAHEELLDSHRGKLDMACLPTPVPLHHAMHRDCVEAGVAVYLEKPPTLDLAELEDMIRRDKGARHATQVGYNFIGQPTRRTLKAELCGGRWGAVRSAGFRGVWPRSSKYFERNNWAGRMTLGGRLVLDCVMTNAMAHFVHNMLYWSGESPETWARPLEVQCSLFRAHPIESADSVFLSAKLDSGVVVNMAMSHAARQGNLIAEQVAAEGASIRWWKDGGECTGFGVITSAGTERRDEGISEASLLRHNLGHYISYLQGERERPFTTLEDSRPFVELAHLAFLAGLPVVDVGGERKRTHRDDATGEVWHEITDIHRMCGEFADGGGFAVVEQLGGGGPGRAVRASLGQLALRLAGAPERC